MEKTDLETTHDSKRRQRLHELLIALIKKQEGLELLDSESPPLDGSYWIAKGEDPAQWIDRNRRILKRYQDLVRSAITLDALLDSELAIK